MASIPLGELPLLTGGSGRLEGVVTNHKTGMPIAGATVSIQLCGTQWGSQSQGSLDGWRPFFITEADGAFHLDGVPEGRFEVEAIARGFLSHRFSPLIDVFGSAHHARPNVFDILRTHMGAWDEAWTKEFGEHEVIRHHFPTVADGTTTRIAVQLRPGRVISGHVLEPNGAPVAGASVTAKKQWIRVARGGFDVSDIDVGVTNLEGAFAITVFPEEAVEVGIVAPGHAALRVRVESPSDQSVRFVLPPGGRLSGHVVGTSGRILDRVRILAVDPSDPENGVTTDSHDGTWLLEGTPPPPYVVLAWHGFGGAAVVEVRDPSIDLDLKLTPLGTLHGRVTDPTGNPVGGEIIWQALAPLVRNRLDRPANFMQWDIGDMAETKPDGSFELQVVPSPDGKALIHFDWRTDPSWVEVKDKPTLVISEKSAEIRKEQEEIRARFGMERPVTTVESPPPKLPAPFPQLKQEEIEKRNQRWIEFLKSAPPQARIQLLSKLRDEACGTNVPDPRPPSDRIDLLPVFEAGVDNDDDNVRFWAISCIHYMNRSDNLFYFIKALEHADPSIRDYAIISIESLARDDATKVRAIEALKDLLKRERQSWNVALQAALTLARLGVKINPKRFADGLQADGVFHRRCVEGLKVLGCKEGIELILRRFEQADTWNAREYPEALEALTGQKLGRNPQPWRDWIEANRASLPPQWV